MPPTERRLFVGLLPDEEVTARLSRRILPTLLDDDERPPEGIRPYAPADLHLTLAFLGSFPEERRSSLQGALREELRGLNAPELLVSGTGSFPDESAPKVLWAGIEERYEAVGRLAALHNRVEQACRAHGWRPSGPERRPERRALFRPHMTVARVAAGTEVHPAFHRLDFDVPWLPVDVHLVESRPEDPEERYRSLYAVPLVVRPG